MCSRSIDAVPDDRAGSCSTTTRRCRYVQRRMCLKQSRMEVCLIACEPSRLQTTDSRETSKSTMPLLASCHTTVNSLTRWKLLQIAMLKGEEWAKKMCSSLFSFALCVPWVLWCGVIAMRQWFFDWVRNCVKNAYQMYTYDSRRRHHLCGAHCNANIVNDNDNHTE